MIMVPLDDPLDPEMPITQALEYLDDNEFDLALLRTPEVRIVYRDRLREISAANGGKPVKSRASSPRGDRLIEHSLELGEVAKRLREDSVPLLVVGRDGPQYIVTRADFTRPAGQAGALAVLVALDALFDELLQPFEAEGWNFLPKKRRGEVERSLARAHARSEELHRLSYLTPWDRFLLTRMLELGTRLRIDLGDQSEHELITSVRNDIAHGREAHSGTKVIEALEAAERIMDAVADYLSTPAAGDAAPARGDPTEPNRVDGLARRVTRAFMASDLDLAKRPGAPASGWDGMPEVSAALRVLARGATERQLRMFLTLTVAVDRARESDRLWAAAASLFERHPDAFDPSAVAADAEEARALFKEFGVTQRHGPDGDAWVRIANVLNDSTAAPEIKAAIDAGQGDADELLRAVRRARPDGPLFPLLRGPKSRQCGCGRSRIQGERGSATFRLSQSRSMSRSSASRACSA